ncbi:hypothetical protein U4E84_14955 [Halorubrum sp. AD140]|uniref:hypothetical protein n=1 Tax=Halorubrum sp. AD140 TaxID=3050073 RepID=UPI002ACC4A32|nr:hypothetical protein [Halorubrum sp. AD140]MDZ5812645.1 hypothetical protein [Halorubrum sp. AD140]
MRFTHDRRGQSVVIGTVILFGFLILALSLYQVQIVPQENAQVEFQHFEEVRNDLVELRAGVLQAGSSDRPQYETVRLGTTYSTRLFAINPPAPAGTIQTSDSYNITIEGDSGDPVNVSTRFLQYQPGYNELDPSSTWYDASVLYLDARDEGGGLAVIEDQELVNDEGEVRITALQNDFSRSGTGRVTLELYPAEGVTDQLPEGNLTVTVPTRLSEEDWEEKTDLPTDSDVYGGVTGDANDDGVHNLTLDTTDDNLTVDTVGVQEAPEEPTQNADGAVGGGDGDDGTTVRYPTSGTANAGTLSNFENMQADDGNVAELEGEGGSGQAFDVTTTTDNVPASDYTLEIQVEDGSSFQGSGTDVTISDANGEIGSGTISESGLFTIDLDPSVEGDISVNYQGRNKNTDLEIQFQRLV